MPCAKANRDATMLDFFAETSSSSASKSALGGLVNEVFPVIVTGVSCLFEKFNNVVIGLRRSVAEYSKASMYCRQNVCISPAASCYPPASSDAK